MFGLPPQFFRRAIPGCRRCQKSWKRRSDDPILLADDRVLETLGDAGRYLTALPARLKTPRWEAAIKALLLVSETREVAV
jgi:hypothetical protein